MEHRFPGSDHEIVIGRLQYVETPAGGAAPLLFWRDSYLSLDDQQA